MAEFKVGDKVIYCLRQGKQIYYCPSTILRIGPKRVTIHDEKWGFNRVVGPNNLASACDHDFIKVEPEGRDKLPIYVCGKCGDVRR